LTAAWFTWPHATRRGRGFYTPADDSARTRAWMGIQMALVARPLQLDYQVSATKDDAEKRAAVPQSAARLHFSD
jgi:hypothetical protein